MTRRNHRNLKVLMVQEYSLTGVELKQGKKAVRFLPLPDNVGLMGLSAWTAMSSSTIVCYDCAYTYPRMEHERQREVLSQSRAHP